MIEYYAQPQPSADFRRRSVYAALEWLGRAVFFMLKCIVLIVVFWNLWLFGVRPLMNGTLSSPTRFQQSQARTQDELMRAYRSQIRAAKVLQSEYRRQSDVAARHEKRINAILAKQEELNRRFEAVLQHKEKRGQPVNLVEN